MRTAEGIARANQRSHVLVLHRGAWVDATLIRWDKTGRRGRVEFRDRSRRTIHKDDVRWPE